MMQQSLTKCCAEPSGPCHCFKSQVMMPSSSNLPMGDLVSSFEMQISTRTLALGRHKSQDCNDDIRV